jgi:hypothetical protein
MGHVGLLGEGLHKIILVVPSEQKSDGKIPVREYGGGACSDVNSEGSSIVVFSKFESQDPEYL